MNDNAAAPPNPPSGPPSLPPGPGPNGFVLFWVDVWRCIRRVAASNFQTVRATPAEARKLAVSGTPITEPVGQSYGAWRRSALWFAAVALFIHVVVLFSTFRFAETQVRKATGEAHREEVRAFRKEYRKNPRMYDAEAMVNPMLKAQIDAMNNESCAREERQDAVAKMIGSRNFSVLDALTLVDHAFVFVSCVVVVLSAVFWSNLRLSRLLSRIGGGLLFFTPVMMAFIPIRSLLDFPDVQDEKVKQQILLVLGGIAAVGVFASVGAKVLAIFPGIIRSSMGLKTLLPESATPGWIVALIAPLYVLVVLLFLVTANQLQGSWMLIVAAICLLLAPATYLAFAKAIVRPHSAREISSVVVPVRLIVLGFNSVGLVFLCVWVVRLDFVGLGTVFEFVFGLVANVMLLTVVVTDVVVQTMRLGYIQSRGFQDSKLRASLDHRFADLAQIGRRREGGDVAAERTSHTDDSLVVNAAEVRRSDDSLVVNDE